jgi:hypothetical protein
MEPSFSNNNMIVVSDNEGKRIALEHDDITSIIFKALKSIGTTDRLLALNLADKVMHRLCMWSNSGNQLSVSDVEQMTRFVLNESGQTEAGRQQLNIFKQVTELS